MSRRFVNLRLADICGAAQTGRSAIHLLLECICICIEKKHQDRFLSPVHLSICFWRIERVRDDFRIRWTRV